MALELKSVYLEAMARAINQQNRIHFESANVRTTNINVRLQLNLLRIEVQKYLLSQRKINTGLQSHSKTVIV
jgi:hypothetical protein